MKKLTALLVLMLTMVLSILPAQAEVERSKLLDAAFSMLEEGNDFVRRYNEITGAEVTATFVDGCPYFFGGKADDETTLTRLFSRAPLYSKREIWEQTRFYDKGSYYLYGLDCSGFTQWVYAEAGLPKHDSLSNMILQYGKYGKNHVYSHRKGKGMPSYDKLAENLQVGDLLVADGCCDVLALEEVADFLVFHMEQAGRVKLKCSPLPLDRLEPPAVETRTIRDTVSSLRLDAMAASGFSLSRGKAADLIASGRVQLNHRECVKPDHAVAQGDVLSCRGLGKCVLTEVGGPSKKGRILIVLERYV